MFATDTLIWFGERGKGKGERGKGKGEGGKGQRKSFGVWVLL